MSNPQRAEIDVEVRYAETDQMGVVHHSVYLVWFELARTRLCLLSGYHYADIERLGYHLVVTRTETRILASTTYGETVNVGCWLDKMMSRGLRFHYEVRRDGRVLTTGATEHIWIDRSHERPCRIPGMLKEPFERLAGKSSGGAP